MSEETRLFILVTCGWYVSTFEIHCPSSREWSLRARSFCRTDAGKYTCLFDAVEFKYIESCLGPRVEIEGFMTTINRQNFDKTECPSGSFQPTTFSTNEASSCIYVKSNCSDEGQLTYKGDDDSPVKDRKCSCDYSSGFSYLHNPKNKCYCLPSEEDCTCYRKGCDPDEILSQDYNCIKKMDIAYTSFSCLSTPIDIHGGESIRDQVKTSNDDDIDKTDVSKRVAANCILIIMVIASGGICAIVSIQSIKKKCKAGYVVLDEETMNARILDLLETFDQNVNKEIVRELTNADPKKIRQSLNELKNKKMISELESGILTTKNSDKDKTASTTDEKESHEKSLQERILLILKVAAPNYVEKKLLQRMLKIEKSTLAKELENLKYNNAILQSDGGTKFKLKGDENKDALPVGVNKDHTNYANSSKQDDTEETVLTDAKYTEEINKEVGHGTDLNSSQKENGEDTAPKVGVNKDHTDYPNSSKQDDTEETVLTADAKYTEEIIEEVGHGSDLNSSQKENEEDTAPKDSKLITTKVNTSEQEQQRAFKIIKAVYPRWIEENDLMSFLNTTQPTLTKALEELNELQKIERKTQENKMMVIFKPEEPCQDIEHNTEEDVRSIVEAAFPASVNVDNLARVMPISRSTLDDIINNLYKFDRIHHSRRSIKYKYGLPTDRRSREKDKNKILDALESKYPKSMAVGILASEFNMELPKLEELLAELHNDERILMSNHMVKYVKQPKKSSKRKSKS